MVGHFNYPLSWQYAAYRYFRFELARASFILAMSARSSDPSSRLAIILEKSMPIAGRIAIDATVTPRVARGIVVVADTQADAERELAIMTASEVIAYRDGPAVELVVRRPSELSLWTLRPEPGSHLPSETQCQLYDYRLRSLFDSVPPEPSAFPSASFGARISWAGRERQSSGLRAAKIYSHWASVCAPPSPALILLGARTSTCWAASSSVIEERIWAVSRGGSMIV